MASYVIRIQLRGTDLGSRGVIQSAPYFYDRPGDAMEEWNKLLQSPVILVRLEHGAWALIPSGRVRDIRLLPTEQEVES